MAIKSEFEQVQPSDTLEAHQRLALDHGRLRAKLFALDVLARRVIAHEDGFDFDTLLREARNMARDLTVHLDAEEALLVPILLERPDGEARKLELLEDHIQQRADLHAVLYGNTTRDRTAFAEHIRWLVQLLLRDMDREDRELEESARELGIDFSRQKRAS